MLLSHFSSLFPVFLVFFYLLFIFAFVFYFILLFLSLLSSPPSHLIFSLVQFVLFFLYSFLFINFHFSISFLLFFTSSLSDSVCFILISLASSSFLLSLRFLFFLFSLYDLSSSTSFYISLSSLFPLLSILDQHSSFSFFHLSLDCLVSLPFLSLSEFIYILFSSLSPPSSLYPLPTFLFLFLTSFIYFFLYLPCLPINHSLSSLFVDLSSFSSSLSFSLLIFYPLPSGPCLRAFSPSF